MRRVAQCERGYNLVEVLLAMALLGTVLISIMALFFWGQKNVYSGKQMTNAVTMATHVLEDLNALNKRQTLATFGLLTAGSGTSNTVFGTTYPNSFVLTTTNIVAANDPNGLMTSWRDQMVNNNIFQDGAVTLVLTPIVDGTNSPPQMVTSDMLRVRAYVTWREAARQRMITVDAMKIDRQQ